jgi:hypothetical protein
MMTMRELFSPVGLTLSALGAQLHAALSIPLTDAAQFDESEGTGGDRMEARRAGGSIGSSLKCVDDRPGYLTRNGLGSLEVGASRSPIGE